MRVTIDIEEKYDEFLKELMEYGEQKDVECIIDEVNEKHIHDCFDEEGNRLLVYELSMCLYVREGYDIVRLKRFIHAHKGILKTVKYMFENGVTYFN
jgi:hypothetical protein